MKATSSVPPRHITLRAAIVALVVATLVVACKRKEAPLRLRVFLTSGNVLSHGSVEAIRKVAAAFPGIKLIVDYHVDEERLQIVQQHGSLKSTSPATNSESYIQQQWTELEAARAHVCAVKHNGVDDPTLAFLSCLFSGGDQKNMPWEPCAIESKLPVARLRACIEGDEAPKLLADAARTSAKARITGTPAFFVAGKQYLGPRTSYALSEALCRSRSGDKPRACAALKRPPPLKGLWLTDRRCDTCETMEAYESALKRFFFPDLTLRSIDYSTDEGKALFARLGSSTMKAVLPALFIEKAVADDEAFAQIRQDTEPLGDLYRLRVAKASFVPTQEICDNGIDDTGDGKVDCDEPSCVPTRLCRPLKQMSLEILATAIGPHLRDQTAVVEAIHRRFDGDLAIGFQFFAEESATAPSGFISPVGEADLFEALRQLCIQAHQPFPQLLAYVSCRSKNVASDWRSCAANPIDADAVNACAVGEEGKRLMKDSIATISATLGGMRQPTFVVNNRYFLNELKEERVVAEICRRNPTHPRCKDASK
jgi:hypothetical protein